MNLTEKSLKDLILLRENTNKVLLKSQQDETARQMLKDVKRELERRYPEPNDGWSKGEQGEPRFYREQGQVLASVIRIETHGNNRGGYEVEVRGQVLPETPYYVDEARSRAEAKLRIK